mmetsp:Transcript_34986/g.26113  ORF Transcript_34986/g.26113 Transcript_34986/m.26113 type:complete len:266 (+) Transcript_34986:252-1049(+)
MEEKRAIAANIKLIRDAVKDFKPENVILELCQERYDSWYYNILSHPNYDRTINDIHKILDKEEAEMELLRYGGLDVTEGNIEYLVGMDVCSYRLPCKTVFGDRNFSITKKRFNSKLAMLQVYRDLLQTKAGSGGARPKSSGSIFDFEEGSSLEKDEQLSRLKKLIRDSNEESAEGSKIKEHLQEQAMREANKGEEDVRREVFIDEVNEELLKSAQKCKGTIVVMLMRKERLKDFEKLWRAANLDFYSTQEHRRKESLKKEAATPA